MSHSTGGMGMGMYTRSCKRHVARAVMHHRASGAATRPRTPFPTLPSSQATTTHAEANPSVYKVADAANPRLVLETAPTRKRCASPASAALPKRRKA
jgi:hypothetical protein